jgi:16S rRNA (cytosine967-C5)-methyltransferase
VTPAARLSAAIEVLADIEARRRPAADALADWGKAHRFAGSGDRAAIGNLVFDALRRKASLAWAAGEDTPRPLVLALVARHWADLAELDRLASGERFAPAPLTEAERAALSRPDPLEGAPPHVVGDTPEWADAALARVFGEARAEEGRALAERAPVDLRVNTLKSDRARALAALEPLGAAATPLSPVGLRIAPGRGPARSPHVEAEAAYQKGWVELQDEGSQIAAILADARPGEQVADPCAGGGGKTLALAAAMENRGQLWAWDEDRHRLAPIFQRLERAGARNVQVKRGGDPSELAALRGRMDLVVLDVPCSGSGAWRRRPDAKWRMRESALPQRMAEQDAILTLGAGLVRPGGRLAYVTCSLFAEENEDRVLAFLSSEAGRGFAAADPAPVWRRLLGGEPPSTPAGVAGLVPSVRLSPRSTGTDGFFVALLARSG